MTFLERYNSEQTWYGKVIVMEIYHLATTSVKRDWTIAQTATVFGCSIGLVSENLRIAASFHDEKNTLINCKTRQEAVNKLSVTR